MVNVRSSPRSRQVARFCGLMAAALVAVGCQAGGAAASDLDAAIGRAMFRRAWTPAPSSTRSNDGLGPLFNARACTACHKGLDRASLRLGRGGIIENEDLVMRLSDAEGRGDPVYGVQLQTSGVPGVAPEGTVRKTRTGLAVTGLGYGPLAPGIKAGGRISPQLWGLGLLEQVPEDVVRALADPDDKDGDGVRGRPNLVTVDPAKPPALGRFGWKAQAPTILEQSANAFSADMGLASVTRPAPWGDCTDKQPACRSAPHGGTFEEPEISQEILTRMAAYLAQLPAPAPVGTKPADQIVEQGLNLFKATGCATCHRPELPSPRGPVRAFTDLLLHDMGPELDGGATEPGVKPAEWRTAPLWGLSRTLANGAGLLHDGRAATIEEAIRFHGGEASGARTRFQGLSSQDRARLIAYVGSL